MTKTYSVCRNHNPIISSFMTYHRVCNKSNKTGATHWAGTAYPSAHPSSPIFSGVRFAQSLVFCVMLCRSLFILLSFFVFSLYCMSFDLRLLITLLVSSIYVFWLPLWCLRFTPSDNPFGILDLRLLITTLIS